jgi:hypothetical protein
MKAKYHVSVCEICGTKFKSYHENDKYCSKKCKMLNHSRIQKQYRYSSKCPECSRKRQLRSKKDKSRWHLCMECFRKYTKCSKLRELIQAEKLVGSYQITITQLTESNHKLKTDNEQLKRTIDLLEGKAKPLVEYKFVNGNFATTKK